MTSSFLVADLDLALLEDLRNERERERKGRSFSQIS